MRVFGFIALLLAVQACTAGPSPRVSHSHDGRTHTHSLPPIGLAHRHGAGSAGVLARSSTNNSTHNTNHNTNQTGSISSSVDYGESRTQPKPRINPRQRQPTIINSRVSPPPATSKNNNFTKGDTSCRRGEADCNVCAANVQQQFNKAASGRINWHSKPWRFTWPQKYPPFDKRPLDIFDGDPAYALGIPDTHVQGFARTNSARFPFVGSHSHKRKGGVFVIKQEPNGRKYLATLHPTKGRHPSGIQVIGNFLVYGDQGNLVFKDLASHNQKRGASIKILPHQKHSYGGGLGLLRISKDNLLLLTTGPGSQDSRPRHNYFYQVETRNNLPIKIKLLDKSPVTTLPNWPRNLAFSENLSLMTECGTGDIYAIHTTGDSKGIKAISGSGYWRLSKLNKHSGKLVLSPINAFMNRQNMNNCNVRAAATVYVNPQHRLEFYCHGYAKDPDGSTFNVLGSSSRNADKFYFKSGTL